MPYYLYIHNIYLYQCHDTKPNPINIDWLLGLTPAVCHHQKGGDCWNKMCLTLPFEF